MHGVTGRMGMNQHLIRSILAIRQQGGVALKDGSRVMPDPILVGRNAEKVEALAKAHGVARWSADLSAALANRDDTVFFDAGTTQMRPGLLEQASQGRQAHLLREADRDEPRAGAASLQAREGNPGSRTASCRTSCSCPGMLKLQALRDSGFFGRMLAVRGEFGYWVFEGDEQPAQRPSWNYRSEDGGGMILDMVCHWRYVLDNLFGEVKAVSCLGAKHIPERWDEAGKKYQATADDAAYATFELEGGVIAHINMSGRRAFIATTS
jgi:predicted dehydrogenase